MTTPQVTTNPKKQRGNLISGSRNVKTNEVYHIVLFFFLKNALKHEMRISHFLMEINYIKLKLYAKLNYLSFVLIAFCSSNVV